MTFKTSYGDRDYRSRMDEESGTSSFPFDTKMEEDNSSCHPLIHSCTTGSIPTAAAAASSTTTTPSGCCSTLVARQQQQQQRQQQRQHLLEMYCNVQDNEDDDEEEKVEENYDGQEQMTTSNRKHTTKNNGYTSLLTLRKLGSCLFMSSSSSFFSSTSLAFSSSKPPTTTSLTTSTNTVNTPRSSSSMSNDSIRNRTIRFRPIEVKDRARIQSLHEEWFPVVYQEEFYDQLVLHRMPHTGEPLYTCVATNRYDPTDTIIACVVGATVDANRLNSNSRRLLVNDPQRHSKLFYIMTLGTVTEYRQVGLGTALVETCMQQVLQDPQCGVLYLHVITLNQSAIRFYERLGFWRVQEIQDYYTIDGKNYNCYLYAKYYHGNRGHLGIFNIMSRWMISVWERVKAPFVFFLDNGAY